MAASDEQGCRACCAQEQLFAGTRPCTWVKPTFAIRHLFTTIEPCVLLRKQYASGTFVMEHRYSNLETLSQLGELSPEVATLSGGRQQTAYRCASVNSETVAWCLCWL